MFKEPAYWMYYFWSQRTNRARKDKGKLCPTCHRGANRRYAVGFLNPDRLSVLCFRGRGDGMCDGGWFLAFFALDGTSKEMGCRFNPVAYLFAAAMPDLFCGSQSVHPQYE